MYLFNRVHAHTCALKWVRRLRQHLSLSSDAPNSSTQAVLQARIREYKLAALHSKQEGDMEMATKYYRLAKVGVLYPAG